MAHSALLIDIENIASKFLTAIFETVEQSPEVGSPNIRRAYAHWDAQAARTKDKVLALGIDPVHVTKKGKNSSDERLHGDVLEMLGSFPSIQTYAIVSGDHGFRKTFAHIHAHHKFGVLCCSEETASRALRRAADLVILIPRSREHGPASVSSSTSRTPLLKQVEGATNPRVGDTNAQRRILDLIKQNANYRKQLGAGGVPIGSLAEMLRPLKNPSAGKNRWLVRLLHGACDGTELCLARSKVDGEHRLFLPNRVNDGYELLNLAGKTPHTVAESSS